MADNTIVIDLSFHRFTIVLLACVVLLSVFDTPAYAQQAQSSRRLERVFDFEDTDDRGNKIGNVEGILPQYWYAIGRQPLGAENGFRDIPLHDELIHRAGYPNFSEIRFDAEHHNSGDFSLYMDSIGGATGVFMQVGSIEAVGGSDYQLSTMVRTQDLDHAWAELRFYFIDSSLNPIPGSMQRSDPVQSNGQWERISVKLLGDYPQATWIGIEMHIVQPGFNVDSPLGRRQVVPQDISGGAWFDDIAVFKLPHVELSTQSPVNIINDAEGPVVSAIVRDFSGQQLEATLFAYDASGKEVDSRRQLLGHANEVRTWDWKPDLPGYGWYIIELRVAERGAQQGFDSNVTRTIGSMLWVPPTSGDLGQDMARFMVVAESLGDDEIPLLAELMEATALRGVVIPAWDRRSTPENLPARQASMEPLIRDLTIGGGKVVMSFSPVPIELAMHSEINTQDPLDIFSTDSEAWVPYLKPVLGPHGQRISHWQLGSTVNADAFYAYELPERMELIERRFRTMAPSPTLVLPWRVDQSSRDRSFSPRRDFALQWSQGFTPENLGEALSTWPVPAAQVRLDIELADADTMPHSERIADMMLRVLHAWELDVGAVGLPSPWTQGHSRHPTLLPDPALGALVTTARHLSGQRVIGRLHLGQGLRCMILDGTQGGMLVVWNERAQGDQAEVEMYLGQSPVLVDHWGNQTPLEKVEGVHRFTVTKTPQFITGIDPLLAQFRAGFALDDPFIESTQTLHERVLHINNPWPRTINGQYIITGPEGWNIQPSIHRFSISPGGSIAVPVSMRFPIHEDSGIKSLTAHFEFQAVESYDVTVSTPIELGLRGVEFDSTVILVPGQTPGTTDALVTLNATNRSAQPMSLYMFTNLRGHARREILAPAIAPGEMATRQMRLTNVDEAIGQYPLRCGVRETNGPAILNQVVELEPPE